MSALPHQKIIQSTSVQILKPAGFKQKGRSRLWLRDFGWFVNFIELTPHKWDRGTHFVTGISWLWYPRTYWTFDVTLHRSGLDEFIKYDDDESFQSALTEDLTRLIEMLRDPIAKCQNFDGALSLAANYSNGTCWENFNLSILTALSGETQTAHALLRDILQNYSENYDWQRERADYVAALMPQLECTDSLHRFLNDKIRESRELKKMESLPDYKLPVM